mmetsp:Transcript_46152/g.133753  ORF Transcript_46152/g.133753 Transcript_46152/m.133753 type:complete len:361 (-) Transcript_46152:28-1110(-)
MATAHSNLYVTGLPEGLDEPTFRQLFEGYGTISSVKLIANMRYGFVKFATVEEAEAVVNELNGSMWGDSTITVKFANNDQGKGGAPRGGVIPSYGKAQGGGSWGSGAGGGSWASGEGGTGGDRGATIGDQVYIKGLPQNFSDDQLFEVFGAYGQVAWHKVLRNNGSADSVALVQMISVDEASWLVENLNGNIPQGLTEPVSVTFSQGPKKSRGKAGGKEGGGARYEPYAAATAAVVIPPAAAAAGAGGVAVQPRAVQPSAYAGDAYAGDEGSNLYVKGLPPTVDELYLYKLFAPYGAIQSVKPIAKEWGGTAFVKFAKAEEAQVAVSKVNGQVMHDGSQIQVSTNRKGGGKGAGEPAFAA